jgi:hypothetical protein
MIRESDDDERHRPRHKDQASMIRRYIIWRTTTPSTNDSATGILPISGCAKTARLIVHRGQVDVEVGSLASIPAGSYANGGRFVGAGWVCHGRRRQALDCLRNGGDHGGVPAR